jgi:tripartite-type tricarboxylate transporter receptor subunit TctC
MPSRILARLAVAAVTLGCMAGAAAAQDKWPSRPVTVIVPFAPAATPTSWRAFSPTT